MSSFAANIPVLCMTRIYVNWLDEYCFSKLFGEGPYISESDMVDT